MRFFECGSANRFPFVPQEPITEPIDVQQAVNNRTAYAQRRVIRNGQLRAESTGNWAPTVVTSQARYAADNRFRLTNVTNAANIPVGALVEGNGVGREIYVRDVNVAAQEVTLSQPLSDAIGTQSYTFTRFKYILDFSGFEKLDQFVLEDIEFQCQEEASGVLLAPLGTIMQIRDCTFNRPGHRGISSPGDGCQGMLVDYCQFISHEGGTLTQNRVSVAINSNANDVKIRNCRASQFRHFAVISGAHTTIANNHFFQGDDTSNAIRTAGLVITEPSARMTFTGNYVDNCHIEWANEHDQAPEFASELSFSAMTISDNIFLASHVAPWFTFFRVRPHGAGHFINGMAMTGNLFRILNGSTDRVETVDTSFADLDYGRMKNITFADNSYNQVSIATSNPLVLEHSENSPSLVWTVDCAPKLPFGGRARTVESLVAKNAITTSSNVKRFDMPYVTVEQGPNKDQVDLRWGADVKGTVLMRVRMDNPI